MHLVGNSVDGALVIGLDFFFFFGIGLLTVRVKLHAITSYTLDVK